MITISPLRDKEALDALCEKEQVSCTNAYCLFDGKDIGAYCLYNLRDEYCELVKLGGEYDTSLADGLMRAALAFVMDLGIDKARVAETVDKALTDRLGITKAGSFEIDSIREVIYHCASCHGGNCANCIL